jgi:hypothetical protein
MRSIEFIVVLFCQYKIEIGNRSLNRAGPDSEQLPTAHTCFNTLIVPDYGDDYNKMSDRLGRAVIECEGFGLQ